MVIGKDYIGVGVGAVVLNRRNEILLLLRKKAPEIGYWTMPGGRVHFGETLEDAILREIEEEVRLKCIICRLLGITNHILRNEGVHWISAAFLVEPTHGSPKNMEPDCHEDMKWFSLDRLPDKLNMTTTVAIANLQKLRLEMERI